MLVLLIAPLFSPIVVLLLACGSFESVSQGKQFLVVGVNDRHLAHVVAIQILRIVSIGQVFLILITLALIALRIILLIFLFLTALVKQRRVRVIENVFGVWTNFAEPFKNSLCSFIFPRVRII